jgi:hypothetical protein
MNHDIKHEERQNAALRFLAAEMGKNVLAEVDALLGIDEAAPVLVPAPAEAPKAELHTQAPAIDPKADE